MIKVLLTINALLLIAVKSQTDLISINNKLAIDLLNVLPTNGNNFFSPFSITTTLLMLLNGANGKTEEELNTFMNINDKKNLNLINDDIKTALKCVTREDKRDLVMKLANLMLVSNDFPLKTNYQNIMKDMFDSYIESVNFGNDSQKIMKDINDWVYTQTNGKIRDISREKFTKNVLMVLINTIYFKGLWKYLFDRKNTIKGNFFEMGREAPIQVDMMSMRRKVRIRRSKHLNARIFEMPFATGTDMSMIIILPNEINGLNRMTIKLTPNAINNTIQALRKQTEPGKTTNIIFPKFTLESEYDLKDSFQKLGLNTIFDDSADLSGINGKSNLKVSKFIHKGFIEVNEEGAEAAAVSKVVLILRSFRTSIINVDRPFAFAIVDKTNGLIWFVGEIRSLLHLS